MRRLLCLFMLFLAFSLRAEEVVILEAESAVLNGVETASIRPGFSGSGYVSGFDNDNDSVLFRFTMPEEGHYALVINAAVEPGWGSKINDILVNDKPAGSFKTEDKGVFTDHPGVKIWLAKGSNTIRISKNWGWFDFDRIAISPASARDLKMPDASLVTPRPHPHAVRLMRYLTDQYGRKVLSGQQKNYDKDSIAAIRIVTGKEPAVLGLDMMDYSPSRVERGTKSRDVEDAIEWWEQGGIVTFCWHWNAPMHLIDREPDKLWWSGFYARATTFDLSRAVARRSSAEYKALVRDIDAIAVQLKRLQRAGVPVLWRPLHEASGGWFWWGSKGPDAYLRLYRILFDRLVKHHKLDNLIWVWNGQAKDWYPGDGMVDIIGEDVYAADRSHGSEANRFDQALSYTTTPKIVALSENGPLPDPDLMKRDSAWWSWFCTWAGFIEDEVKTTDEVKKRVYSSELVITRDELPDLRNAPPPSRE